jgi:CRP/FNR family transcriptional regulator
VTIDELRGSLLFGGLPADELAVLAAVGERCALPAGRSVFSQGEPGEALYLLVSGGVKVFKVQRDGRRATLRYVRPGETFGESVLYALTYPAFTCTTQDSVVYRFPVGRFRELLAQSPDLALILVGRMAELLVLLNQRVEELLQPVPARLARYLLELCDQQLGTAGGALERGPAAAPRICRLPVSKRELAERLGTVPETLSRILDRFKRAGVIRLSGSGELVEILDFAALERLTQR